MKYLAVKKLEKFQHYHDGRVPTWIKLYNALLNDYAFLQLPSVARSHLILIWLIASRHKNRIPNDANYIRRAIQAPERVNLARLVAAGFLEETDESPSEILELDKSDAREIVGQKRREKKENRERATTSPPRAAAKVARSTWMTPYCAAWSAQYDGDLPVEPSVKPLGKLRTQHGDDEVLRRWAIYLAATPGQYASAAKFAATWGQWSGQPNGQEAPRQLRATEQLV